jgi:hypothetical protein
MHCYVSTTTMLTRTQANVTLYVRYISCFNIRIWIRVLIEQCYRGMNFFFVWNLTLTLRRNIEAPLSALSVLVSELTLERLG